MKNRLLLTFLIFTQLVFSQDFGGKFKNLEGKILVDSVLKYARSFHEVNESKVEIWANKALIYSKKINYKKGELDAMVSLIQSNNHFSKFEDAIKLNLEALKFAEKNKLFSEMPILYNSLASSYLSTNNYSLAIDLFRKSEVEFIKQNKKNELGNTYNNIAVCYDNQDILDSALFYYDKAYPYYIKKGDNSSLGLWYMNVGDLYRKLNKFKEALIFQLKAEKYLLKTDDFSTLLILYNGMSLNYICQKDEVKAFKYIQLAESLAKKINVKLELANVYYTYFEIYKYKNDCFNQLKYLTLYLELIENIYSVENVKSINELHEKYENDKKYKEIELLNKNKKLQELEISKHKNSRNFLIGLSLLAAFVLIILTILFRNKTKSNKILEFQKAEISQQKKIVDEKNKEILDSIKYAKRIQSAILPQPKLVKEYFKDSFIIYKPKDIVAGDFYWFESLENIIYFAAADCTGHGVPGAMVSVVCHNALNRSVKEYNLSLPSDILNKTREIVVEEFEKSDDDVKDGMDISLCAINLVSNVLHWAGAHNPLWILRNSELIEFKADKQPIGKFAFAKDFTKHEILLQKDDEIYIFTDGFQDQFGGEKGKKYKVAQLRELLLSLNFKTMEEKQTKIEEAFENWKGELEQVDDVCIIGVHI